MARIEHIRSDPNGVLYIEEFAGITVCSKPHCTAPPPEPTPAPTSRLRPKWLPKRSKSVYTSRSSSSSSSEDISKSLPAPTVQDDEHDEEGFYIRPLSHQFAPIRRLSRTRVSKMLERIEWAVAAVGTAGPLDQGRSHFFTATLEDLNQSFLNAGLTTELCRKSEVSEFGLWNLFFISQRHEY